MKKLSAMGFNKEMSKLCLKAFKNNMNKSLDFFTQNKDLMSSLDPNNFNSIRDKLKNLIEANKEASTSSSSEDTASALLDEMEKTKNAQELIANLASEMPKDEDAYLDFNLDEDSFFINKYYSLLD